MIFRVFSFEEDIVLTDSHSLKPRGCVEDCIRFNPEKKKTKIKT